MRVRMSVRVIAILLTLTPINAAGEAVQAPPAPTRWQKIKTFISEHREAIISSAATAAAVVLLIRWYYQRQMAALDKKSARDQKKVAALKGKLAALAAERDSALQSACEVFAENERLIGDFQRLQGLVPHLDIVFTPSPARDERDLRLYSPDMFVSPVTNHTSAALATPGGSPDDSAPQPRILAGEFDRQGVDGSKTG